MPKAGGPYADLPKQKWVVFYPTQTFEHDIPHPKDDRDVTTRYVQGQRYVARTKHLKQLVLKWRDEGKVT